MKNFKRIVAAFFFLAAVGCDKLPTEPAVVGDTSIYVKVTISGIAGDLVLKSKSGEKVTANANGELLVGIPLDATAADIAAIEFPENQLCKLEVVDPSNLTVTCRDFGVGPLYGAGVNWNDYVRNDGPSRTSAQNIPCLPVVTFGPNMGQPIPGGYQACIHGGEFRQAPLPEFAKCDGLSAKDSAGALQWKCEVGPSGVRMVSTGLAPGHHLSDLLDFSGVAWKKLTLTLFKDGVEVVTSKPLPWWFNPVVDFFNNPVAGGNFSLATIFIAPIDPPVGAGKLLTGKDAFVIKPGSKLRMFQGVCGTPVTISGMYNWFEGTIEANDCGGGISTNNMAFSVLRNVKVQTAAIGIRVENSPNNRFEDMMIAGPSAFGLQFINSRSNTIARLEVFSQRAPMMGGLSAVRFEQNSNDNVLVSAYVTNNNASGITLTPSSGQFMAAITTAYNYEFGINIQPGSARNTVMNYVANLNTQGALLVAGNIGLGAAGVTRDNTFVNLAVSGYMTNIALQGTDSNYFTGLLKTSPNMGGFNCSVGGGNRPGLNNGSCTDDGQYGSSRYTGQNSDAVYLPALSLEKTFVGKVLETDPLNTSNGNGVGANLTFTSDWISFLRPGRAWGLEPLVGMNPSGGCQLNSTCRLYDWNPVQGELGDFGPDIFQGGRNDRPAILGQVGCPTANSFLEHSWAAATESACIAIPGAVWRSGGSVCRTRYLKGAIEIAGSGGNDNYLCEAGETCLYASNMGAYQGHGELVSASKAVAFTQSCADHSGITLKKYSVNGY